MPDVLATGATEAASLRRPAGPRHLTITVYLFLFAAALLVPVFVLAASALVLYFQTQRNVARVEIEQRAGTAARVVGRQFARLQEAAHVLASSPLLGGGDIVRFRKAAAIDGVAFGFRLVLIDPGGPEVVFDSAGLPSSTMLGEDVAELVRRAASRPLHAAARVAFSPVSTRAGVFTAFAPVQQGGTTRYVVATVLPSDVLAQRLRQVMPDDGTVVMVADRNGTVVARTDDGAVGTSGPDWLLTLVSPRSPADAAQTPAGAAAAAVALPSGQWTVAVRLASAAAVPAQRALGLFGIAGLTLIALGVAVALVLAQRIANSVHALAALGMQLVHDPGAPPIDTPVTEVNEVGRALANAAETRSELELELRQMHKMEAVGRLTGGIAHDFNNLLTIIIGNLEMLAEECGLTLDEKQLQLIADAQESATLSANLVSQLLAFARSQPLDPVMADIGEVVRATSHLLERTLGETVELKIDVAEGLRARVDVPQLETVILNLAINARDAMPDGGTLRIAAKRAGVTDEETAKLRLPVGRYVALAVTDTGTGMTSEICERAFDPFFTTKPLGIGTGLGLSVVYGFAKQSGGGAWIHSEVGQGTTVELWIPEAGDLPVISEPVIRTVPSEQASGATILLVDDNAKVRTVAARLLRLLGFVVLEAGDGPSALAIMSRDPAVDVLFTDIVMRGGLTGFELARKAVALKPDLAVLFTSGYATAELEAQNVGGRVRWLRKPYTSAQLTAALEGLLSPPAPSAREMA